MTYLSIIDWVAIAKIIGIDIMLGVDNAVVIALACAALPLALRNRAMILGTVFAVLLRAVLLAIASYLMGLSYLKLIAGAYLLYIGFNLLMSGDDEHEVPAASKVFAAVKTIVIADFMMSLDNVLAVAAAARSSGQQYSTLYAIAGVTLSIPVIVFGAKFLTTLMDRYKIIVWFGAGLLGWVGVEMALSDPLLTHYVDTVRSDVGEVGITLHHLAGFVVVVVAALIAKRLDKRAGATA